jgi:hypothetical protein
VQTSVTVGVDALRTSTPPLFIEVEKSISQKLANLADKENLPIKILASRLIAYMLLYHRKEVNELITRMKRPEAW